jgi:Uma2 family endonuclease
MSEPAVGRMTLDEFLRWDDGTETPYELIDGCPLAMAPPAEAHRILAMRLGSRIDGALVQRRPCNAQAEAGVLWPDRADAYFVADIGVTCRPNIRRRQAIEEPILLVEILSPASERHDRRIKLPVYRRIASVEEILLLDSQSRYGEVLRRDGDRWITELVQGAEAVLRLTSVDLALPMAELYDGIDLEDAETAGRSNP